ncbi:MAG: hypothetical protein JWQ71_1739 [Pedosphaera sp.]|nr:hypothetical protein [Pedosphaera sp.]
MLYAITNKKFSAVGLFGDYYDLKDLHSYVTQVVSGDSLPAQLKEFLLSFGYDLRKAYEGKREKQKLGTDWLDEAQYRGIYIYWPYFIFYLRLLRQAASSRPTSRAEYALMCTLEGLCESALRNHSGSLADQVLRWLQYSSPFDDHYLTEWWRVCCRLYLEEAQGKKRFSGLSQLLFRVSPISPEYRKFYEQAKGLAAKENVSIFSVEDPTPWPQKEELGY